MFVLETASTLATLILGSNVELGDCNSTSSDETVDAEVSLSKFMRVINYCTLLSLN